MRIGLSVALTRTALPEGVPSPAAAWDFTARSLAPTDGGRAITFSRGGTANYFDAVTRRLVQAAAQVPRFDSDPVTGANLGLLREAAALNPVLHNRDLTQTAWVKNLCTAAKNQAGIDGTANSASSLSATLANATCLQTFTSASDTRAATVYLKRLSGTGAVEMTINGGALWTDVTPQMLGTGPNGYSRIVLPKATVTNPQVGFRLGSMSDSIAVDYVQVESRRASSPIATTTAGVTRAGDLVTFDPAGLANAEGYSMFCDCRFGDFSQNGDLLRLHNSALTHTAGVYQFQSLGIRVNTTGGCDIARNASMVDVRAAVRFRANDFRLIGNNFSGFGDTSGTLPDPVALTLAGIGSTATGAVGAHSWIRRLTIWTTPLSNDQLTKVVA